MNGIGLLAVIALALVVVLIYDAIRWKIQLERSRADRQYQHRLRVRENMHRNGLV